jgi:hypothetical protein
VSRVHPAIWVAVILAVAAIIVTVIVVSTQSHPRCPNQNALCYSGQG